MYVIVVGGGKTGSHLTRQLIEEVMMSKLIENRPEIIERLQQELTREALIFGDGSSPETLESAGIQAGAVLAAVTGEDETNLVATTLARLSSTCRAPSPGCQQP